MPAVSVTQQCWTAEGSGRAPRWGQSHSALHSSCWLGWACPVSCIFLQGEPAVSLLHRGAGSELFGSMQSSPCHAPSLPLILCQITVWCKALMPHLLASLWCCSFGGVEQYGLEMT